jgi:hypothetical protein
MDLSDLPSIKKAAEEFKRYIPDCWFIPNAWVPDLLDVPAAKNTYMF